MIISGLGKVQAAAATAYLYMLSGCQGWLNIGVGGHRDWEIGEGVFAHQVIDDAHGERYYPTFGWKLSHKTASVITVDQVETEFETESVYEMEAAGFYGAALRFSTVELVHSFKVISDNKESGLNRDKQLISNLIANHLETIEITLEKILHLQKNLSDDSEHLPTFLKRWHFTSTQQHQLKRLLQRWEACYPNRPILDGAINECYNGKDVIHYLRRCFH